MNGVHDMGGMQDFGPIVPEAGEPWFHLAWERRAFALTLAMGATGAWNLDQARSVRESLPPSKYLASTYYEIWFAGLLALMRERGLVTDDEIASGRLHERPRPLPRRLDGGNVAAVLAHGASTQRPAVSSPCYAMGDLVRTININPPTHTRLPRYCRGKAGTIAAVHGAHVYPDVNALGVGESPQWLYTVRFAAHDLWGPDTTATWIHVDCFEPYLETRPT
jgi:nitrile hydratase subunit beta